MSIEQSNIYGYLTEQFRQSPPTPEEITYAQQQAYMISTHPEYRGLDPKENPFIMRRYVQQTAQALFDLDTSRRLVDQTTPARQIRIAMAAWQQFDETKKAVFLQTLEYYPKLLSTILSQAPGRIAPIRPAEINQMRERIPGFIRFLHQLP